jgi:hypothetical protein
VQALDVAHLPCEEHYTDLKGGKVAAMMEGLYALRYARHFALQGEALETVTSFHNAVKDISVLEFSQLRITRKPVEDTGDLEIVVAAYANDRWYRAGYTIPNPS